MVCATIIMIPFNKTIIMIMIMIIIKCIFPAKSWNQDKKCFIKKNETSPNRGICDKIPDNKSKPEEECKRKLIHFIYCVQATFNDDGKGLMWNFVKVANLLFFYERESPSDVICDGFLLDSIYYTGWIIFSHWNADDDGKRKWNHPNENLCLKTFTKKKQE